MIVTRNTHRQARALQRGGFTLMEVMVVAAILVILAGVGSVALFRYLDDAKENTARLGIAKIETAIGGYRNSHGDQFPPNLQVLTVPENGKASYLEPSDIIDPWGKEFQFNPQQTSNSGKPFVGTTTPGGLTISNQPQ